MQRARDAGDDVATLEDLARSAHLSRFHLSRLVRRELGYSLREFQAALKVERGINALVDGESVTDSQLRAGHESPASYAHAFRSHTGLSPRAYRAAMAGFAAHLIDRMSRHDPHIVIHRGFATGQHRQQHALTIKIDGAEDGSALFTALNPNPVTRDAPLLGLAMMGTNVFEVDEIPDGTYYPMVVKVPRGRGLRPLFHMADNRRDILPQPVTFPLAEPAEVRLTLRPLRASDPPITPNLPKLLVDALAHPNVSVVKCATGDKREEARVSSV